ncbi:MAG: lysophospholipid acyltransferase family protein, partial [Planctomycetes bacterium]|nr:lysophospholipid acyltransferase family protein [Planctomycetota bacterium]
MELEAAPRGLPERVLLALAAGLGVAFAQVLLRTVRVEHLGRGPMERLEAEGRGLIYAIWHDQLLLWTRTHAGRGIHALVSQHRDGELIARALAWLGCHSVRGSSTRGGREALQELVDLASRGVAVGVTPDGPRGPRHVLKPGVVALAAKSGRPIVCAANAYDRAWTLGSWDRFVIPAPFARAVACYGEPIHVPRDAPPEALEGIRAGVEACLCDLTARAEERARGGPETGVADRRPWFAGAAAVTLGPAAALALAALAAPAGLSSAPRAAFVGATSLVAATLLAVHGGVATPRWVGQTAVALAAGLGAWLLGAPSVAALGAALVVLAFGLAVAEVTRSGGRMAGLALAALALALPLLAGPVVEALPSAAARGTATSGLLGASPVAAIVGSALGVDLLRRRETYAISALGAYHPYAYPPWWRTVLGYLAVALVLRAAGSLAGRRGQRTAPVGRLVAVAA